MLNRFNKNIMKQEEKELLIKDLCGRLPYGTMVYAQNAVDWYDSEICTQVLSDVINEDYVVKPYLFPMSSMTDEQEMECQQIKHSYYYDDDSFVLFDWYNKNHIDYRGLINKGLAIDATGLNIYKILN